MKNKAYYIISGFLITLSVVLYITKKEAETSVAATENTIVYIENKEELTKISSSGKIKNSFSRILNVEAPDSWVFTEEDLMILKRFEIDSFSGFEGVAKKSYILAVLEREGQLEGATMEKIEEILGVKGKVSGAKKVFIFDTGVGGLEWQFEIADDIIVSHKKLPLE